VVAINRDVKLSALAGCIHPYPTYAEIIKRAADVFRHGLVTPAIAHFLKKMLELRR
jgi:hypothetical protein